MAKTRAGATRHRTAEQVIAEGSLPRDDAGELDGFQYRTSEQDSRHFSELMLDWMTEVGIVDPNEFIKHIGLEGALTADGLQELLIEEASPGLLLTQYLAELFPSGIASKTVFINRAQSARNNIENTITIDDAIIKTLRKDRVQPAVETAVAKKIPKPAIVASIDPSDAIESEFYQALDERVTELLKGHPNTNSKDAIAKLAHRIGLNPWMLQGYMPLPSGASPQNVAGQLTRVFYDIPDSETDADFSEQEDEKRAKDDNRLRFYELAYEFLRRPRGLDVINGQLHGTRQSFGELLSTLMEYKGIESEALHIALKERGYDISAPTIDNWRTGHSIPKEDDKAKTICEALELKPEISHALLETYAAAKAIRHSDRPKAQAYAKEKGGVQNDLIESGKLANLARALERTLANRKNGEILYGKDNEPLRKSQQEALDAIQAFLHGNKLKGHLVLPGGAGKTRIGMAIADAAKDAHLRTLVLLPSRIAVRGTKKEYNKIAPHLDVGTIIRETKEYDGDVTAITYQAALIEFYRSILAEMRGETTSFNMGSYNVLLPDEGHRYLTELAALFLGNTNAVQIAMTATPYFHEGKKVEDRFDEKIYELPLKEAIERREIAPLRNKIIQTQVALHLDDLKQPLLANEEYSPALEKSVNNSAWNDVFPDVYKTDNDETTGKPIFGEKTFVFCSSIQHSKDMAARFNSKLAPLLKEPEFRNILQKKGIDPDRVKRIAAHVSGDMTPSQVEDTLEAYERGEILVLTSARLLVESYDSPATSVVMNAVPTLSIVHAGQRAMRGSRVAKGKEFWTVYDALPADWETTSVTPVLFSQLTGELYKNIEKRDKKSTKDLYGTRNPGEMEAGYKLVWDIDSILEIIHTQDLKREFSGLKAQPSGTTNLISAIAAVRTLKNLGYSVQKDKVTRHLHDLTSNQTKACERQGQSFRIETEHGPVTGRMMPWHHTMIPYFDSNIVDYLILALQPKHRHEALPQEFVSFIGMGNIIRENGYQVGYSKLKEAYDWLESQVPKNHPFEKPFIVKSEYGNVTIRFGHTVKGKSLFAQSDETLSFMVKKYDLTKKATLPSSGYIHHKKLYAKLADLGVTVDQVRLRETFQKLRAQLPKEEAYQLGKETFSAKIDGEEISIVMGGVSIHNSLCAREEDLMPFLRKNGIVRDKVVIPSGFGGRTNLEEEIKRRGYMLDKNKLTKELNLLKKQIPKKYPLGKIVEANLNGRPVSVMMAEEAHQPTASMLYDKEKFITACEAEGILIKKASPIQLGFGSRVQLVSSINGKGLATTRAVKALVKDLEAALPRNYHRDDPCVIPTPHGDIRAMRADRGSKGCNQLVAFEGDVENYFRAKYQSSAHQKRDSAKNGKTPWVAKVDGGSTDKNITDFQ